MTRRKRERRLHADESDRLLRASRMFGKALALFEGDRDAANEWLATAQPALGGTAPLDLASSEVRQMTYGEGINESPAWAPNGRQLVFSARHNGNEDLYVVDVRTKHTRRLTATPSFEIDPAWSPDGRLIAFVSPSESSFAQVWVVEPNGRGRRPVGPGSINPQFEPSWSPDASMIVDLPGAMHTSGGGGVWTSGHAPAAEVV